MLTIFPSEVIYKVMFCSYDPEDRNSLKSCHKKNEIKTIIVMIEKKNRNYTLLMKRSGLFAKMFNTSLGWFFSLRTFHKNYMNIFTIKGSQFVTLFFSRFGQILANY